MIEPILLTSTHVATYSARQPLTNASGFFFERAGRLYLVTSRHVVNDADSGHFPDRLEIELHTNPDNLVDSVAFSIPLYSDGTSLWHEGRDAAGGIDVAAIEIDRGALPPGATYRAFTPDHIAGAGTIEIGTSLLVVGFPLGFHDTLHHMPVVRQAIVASSFAFRFQGHGYFLTDARTHSGTSGAAVVMRATHGSAASDELPWMLLGVHSARFDISGRDLAADEALGLNCAWYADILMTLTDPGVAPRA